MYAVYSFTKDGYIIMARKISWFDCNYSAILRCQEIAIEKKLDSVFKKGVISMYLAINILGLLVFLGIGFLFSKDKKAINWKAIAIMIVLNLVLAWFLTGSAAGRAGVKAAADGFAWIVNISAKGTVFALGAWYNVKNLNFICSALMPILMIVPLFDILTYIGFLPWIIKWIGKGLSFITGQPKFESFFAVEMMFLGNTEVLAVSGMQIRKLTKARNLTIAMMSMSCVTASILGAYIQMMPGQFILTAVPINIVNSLIATSLLNPVTVTEAEDTIEKVGSSLLGLGKDALQGVADLEQNIGGVETLFKDSADTVIENSKKAYTTAGIDANKYMEQITSFSASLLQSLGGDTEEAAKVGDMAIQDMADNSNKFGTAIENIQNAYQGFAKQNYTIKLMSA